MQYNPSPPRPYRRRGKIQSGRWEVDIRGMLDNGLKVARERRVFPLNKSAGKIGKRQAAAMALEEFERWNRHGQVLRPGETPALLRTGGMANKTAPTFAQFFPDYLDFCASPNACRNGPNSPSTLDTKREIFKLHLEPAFGALRLDQLHRRDVDRYVIKKNKMKRSSTSICMDLSILRHLLVIAKSYELIDKLPEFKVPRSRQRDVVALAPDELERYVAAYQKKRSLRDIAMNEIMLRTGLRCGEMLALRPADVDLEAQQPIVRVLRSYTNGKFGLPKGRTTRVVPLAPSLAARIDELLVTRELSPRATNAQLFSPHGNMSKPLCYSRVYKIVKDLGEDAAVPQAHPHMLRHTFGTECARRGVPLLTIKEWMGHAQLAVTQRYLHLAAPDHLRWATLLGD